MKSSLLTRFAGMPAFLFAVVASLAATGCDPTFEKTAAFPPRDPGCKVEVLGLGATPPAGYGVAATITVPINSDISTPSAILARFQSEICAAGGELLASRVGTFGRGLRLDGVDVLSRLPPVATVSPGATVTTPEAPIGCVPLCGKGFLCENHKCVPPCNPTCDTGELCGADRTCHKVK